MIYVTHDQEEARSLADRIAILNQGRVVQVGTPTECLLRPETTFVARHLGWPPMSFERGRLQTREGVLVLHIASNLRIAPQTWQPFLGLEVLVGSRSHSGHNAKVDLDQLDLSQAFLFDASSGHLLHAPDAQG